MRRTRVIYYKSLTDTDTKQCSEALTGEALRSSEKLRKNFKKVLDKLI